MLENVSICIACLRFSTTLFNHVIVENYSAICMLKVIASTIAENCVNTHANMFLPLIMSYFFVL